MRTTLCCPKCNDTKIGYLPWLPTYSDSEVAGRQCIGTTLAPKPRWTLGTPRNAHIIEAYVCAACGYLEYYAKDPATIPFEQIDGFRWARAR